MNCAEIAILLYLGNDKVIARDLTFRDSTNSVFSLMNLHQKHNNYAKNSNFKWFVTLYLCYQINVW